MFLALLTSLLKPALALHVVIDPGHGGHDIGASHNDLRESRITLEVARHLHGFLAKDRRFRSTLTRDSDRFLSLDERAEIANRLNADLVLSIHVNSSSDASAKGKEIYFQNQLPPDEEALFLANRENQGAKSRAGDGVQGDVAAIVEDLKRSHRLRLSGRLSEELHRHWQGDFHRRRSAIRQAPFFVISNVKAPSALIEIGYLSNPEEAAKLGDSSYLRRIAEGIYNAVVGYKEFMDKTTRQRLD